jgi:hypothetical protein
MDVVNAKLMMLYVRMLVIKQHVGVELVLPRMEINVVSKKFEKKSFFF